MELTYYVQVRDFESFPIVYTIKYEDVLNIDVSIDTNMCYYLLVRLEVLNTEHFNAIAYKTSINGSFAVVKFVEERVEELEISTVDTIDPGIQIYRDKHNKIVQLTMYEQIEPQPYDMFKRMSYVAITSQ